MQLFIIFVFGAVILGAGSMLSPAWPTRQPRIALAGALSLAIVMGGAVFYAELFGWDTLVIDYLLFALLTGILIGGTLSHAQARAEARGEVLEDADQGWPGPQDMIFLGLVALAFVITAAVLPVPIGRDAAGMGYLTLTTRLGETFNTLTPFYPSADVLFPPGLHALAAYLSQQLNQPISLIYMSIGAVSGFMNVWLAYDFGSELRDKRLGRAMGLTMLGGVGLAIAYTGAHIAILMGLVFTQAFLIYAIRYQRHQYPADAVGTGLMLGATLFVAPLMTAIALAGYLPWLATMWFAHSTTDAPMDGYQPAADVRPSRTGWLVMALGIPLVTLVATAPWTLNNTALFDLSLVPAGGLDAVPLLLIYHGVVIPLLAIIGGWHSLKEHPAGVNQAAMLAIFWLVMLVVLIVAGVVPALFGEATHYANVRYLAWFGPIIPYTLLGGIGLLWFWDSWLSDARRNWLRSRFQMVAAVGAVIVVLVLVLNRPLLVSNAQFVNEPGALATHADVEAMRWIRDNTPADSRLLNYPNEGDWAPVLAERDAVYFAMMPFFRFPDETADSMRDEQDAMLSFWADPADPDHAALLRDAGIDYVIVPQVVNQPEEPLYRHTDLDLIPAASSVADAAYLERVYENVGAQVYAVRAE